MANTKIYLKASQQEKANFSESTCSVTISVGQKTQENEKLAATIKVINKSFKECTLMVCDSLQRHTLAINNPTDMQELYDQTIKIGDQWMQSNKQFFSIFTIPYSIIRWDTWLAHNDYQEKRQIINNFFNTIPSFRKAFQNTANTFLARYQSRIGQVALGRNKAQEYCLEYLKEECAVMLLWADKGYNYEIYPSKRIEAMEATHQYLIKPSMPDVLKPIWLELKSDHSKKRASLL